MAADKSWPEEPAGVGSDDAVELGLGNSVPPPAQPLNYARRGDSPDPQDRILPVGVGVIIGFALYAAVAAAWWVVVRLGGGIEAVVWGVLLVPLTASVIAGILQASFGWRGLTAGVSMAFGLSILIGCLGIVSICGSMKI